MDVVLYFYTSIWCDIRAVLYRFSTSGRTWNIDDSKAPDTSLIIIFSAAPCQFGMEFAALYVDYIWLLNTAILNVV